MRLDSVLLAPSVKPKFLSIPSWRGMPLKVVEIGVPMKMVVT